MRSGDDAEQPAAEEVREHEQEREAREHEHQPEAVAAHLHERTPASGATARATRAQSIICSSSRSTSSRVQSCVPGRVTVAAPAATP